MAEQLKIKQLERKINRSLAFGLGYCDTLSSVICISKLHKLPLLLKSCFFIADLEKFSINYAN